MAKKREKRQNHKNDTIKYKLRCELRKMESYGRSKKADMQKTKADREKLRADGATYSESLRINHSKERIYSYSTMENYQKDEIVKVLEEKPQILLLVTYTTSLRSLLTRTA